jgi:hypothetical protein
MTEASRIVLGRNTIPRAAPRLRIDDGTSVRLPQAIAEQRQGRHNSRCILYR